MGTAEKLGRRALTSAALVAALGCSAQVSYADIVEEGDSTIQLPNPLEMNRSMLRLNDAWNALRNDGAVGSILNESRNTLNATKRVSNNKVETVKFQHYYNGLEVIGSMAMHQKSVLGEEVLNRITSLDLDTHPRLQESEATAIAMSLLGGERELSSKPVLKVLPQAEGNGARLIYWIEISESGADAARDVILDANSGEVIGNLSKHLTIAPINVFSAKNQGTSITPMIVQGPQGPGVSGCTVTNMSTGQNNEVTPQQCQTMISTPPANQCQVLFRGNVIKLEPRFCKPQVTNSVPSGSDPAALRAFKNSQAVLSYYQTHHGRNSFDNRGTQVVNVVHAGLSFDNAFWHTGKNFMAYGDGDGKEFGDFTLALDVAGHEQTHGVVSYSANFMGMGESGALNEAFADFFGKMIANDNDWAIGRKLFLNQATAKGVRDLANPAALSFCASVGSDGKCAEVRPYPSSLKQMMVKTGPCDGSNDYCWVHSNATIPGHASYLVVQAIGAQKAEKLYYAALTQVLTSNDSIKTALNSIKTLCPKVLDTASCQAVNKVYAQVGL